MLSIFRGEVPALVVRGRPLGVSPWMLSGCMTTRPTADMMAPFPLSHTPKRLVFPLDCWTTAEHTPAAALVTTHKLCSGTEIRSEHLQLHAPEERGAELGFMGLRCAGLYSWLISSILPKCLRPTVRKQASWRDGPSVAPAVWVWWGECTFPDKTHREIWPV